MKEQGEVIVVRHTVSAGTVTKVIVTSAVVGLFGKVLVKMLEEPARELTRKLKQSNAERWERIRQEKATWSEATGTDKDSVAAKITKEVLEDPEGGKLPPRPSPKNPMTEREQGGSATKRSSKTRSDSQGSGRA